MCRTLNWKRGSYLQILPHVIRDHTKANTREVVDGKPGVFRYINWEHPFTTPLHFLIFEPLCKGLEPHTFHHLAHHDFYEDTTTRRSIFFVDFDTVEYGP